MGRSMGRAWAAGVAAAVVLAVPAAGAPAVLAEQPSGRIKTPPPTIKCVRGADYVTFTAFGEAWLMGRPRPKPLAVSAYIKVTTELQAQAGYNGTLWETKAKSTTKSPNSYYPSRAVVGGPLPVYTSATASSNYRQGLGTYRAKVTTKVYREGPGIDGVTNTRVQYSNTISCPTSAPGGF